jgi:ferredoxin--NADP+ reductase
MLNATVRKKIVVAKGLIVLQVEPDEKNFSFEPGQYATLGLMGGAPRPAEFPAEATPPAADKLIKRPYSISSSPHTKEYVEFYIAILPEGELTSRFELLKEGERIFMAPKMKGVFTLNNVPQGSDLVMVSTGTGLAPFMSMLRLPDIFDKYGKVTLVHGVRYPSDLAYQEEIGYFTANKPLRYEAVVSRADGSFSGHKGYVQDLFKKEIIKVTPTNEHIMLCGNPKMVTDMSEVVTGLGYKEHSKKEPGNLHIEKYW